LVFQTPNENAKVQLWKGSPSLGIDGEHSFDFDPQRGWATVDFA
jgi:hypothetical protein